MTFPMSVGATTILLPERPTPKVVSSLLNECNVTTFFAVPTIFSAILDFTSSNNFDGFKNLKISVSAGEALPENIGKKWYQLTSTHILDGIGSTEMWHIFLSNKIDDLEYGTTGIAVPGYELKLLDENFVYLMSFAYLVLTDSGGIQEEAPSLGIPVLVMRDETERPEALEAGTVMLTGTSKDSIFTNLEKLFNDKKQYKKMSKSTNPYGDGKASKRIVKIIKKKIYEI